MNVLEEFNNGGLGAADEGRAICQVIYDEAPHCKWKSESRAGRKIAYCRRLATIDGTKAGLIFDTSSSASPSLTIGNTVGINPADGFGVVDGFDAVTAVLQAPSKSAPTPLTQNPTSSAPIAPARTLQ